MSARSRYLDAISPRSGDGKVVGPTNNTNTADNTTTVPAASIKPSINIKNGVVRSAASPTPTPNNTKNVLTMAPPPPPPPGPPPAKKNRQRSSVSSSGSSYKYGGSITSSNTNNNTSDAENDEPSQQQMSPPKKSGSIWSPKDEIKSPSETTGSKGGNVAKFQQLLWGNNNTKASPKSSTKTLGSKVTEIHNNLGLNNQSGSTFIPSPSAAGNGNNNTILKPPATPPRPQVSVGYLKSSASIEKSTSVATTNNYSPSPRYKRNAPPPLNKNETPSLALNSIEQQQRKLISPNRITPRLNSGLSVNTGGGGYGHRGGVASVNNNSSVNNSPHSSRSQRYMGSSGGGSPSVGNSSSGGVYIPGGPSPSSSQQQPQQPKTPSSPTNFRSPVMSRDGYQRSNTVKISNTTTTTSSPSSSSLGGNSSPRKYYNTSGDTNDGISTLTAFKRPNAKVGIVFTRYSSSHPEVAIISRILPESIFSRHNALAMSEEDEEATTTTTEGSSSKKKGLEGSEVIAVNGTPVRDPRHAAELVARAVEEVRLTIKRTGGNNNEEEQSSLAERNNNKNDTTVDNIERAYKTLDQKQLATPHKLQRSHPSEKSQEGIELSSSNEIVTQRTQSMQSRGDESELSVRTEEGTIRTEEGTIRTEEGTIRTTEGKSKKNVTQHSGRVIESPRRGSDLRAAPQDDRQAVASTAPTTTSRSNMTSATASTMVMSPKSAEIAERRRKVAQAMLLSEELVEDPIYETSVEISEVVEHDPMQLNRSSKSDDDNEGEEGIEISSAIYGGKTPSVAASGVTGVSGTPSGVSQTPSEADKRRQAALEMYHSSEMVADNVDDLQLGTIDAVSPPPSTTSKNNKKNTINAANLATIGAAASSSISGMMRNIKSTPPASEAGSATRTDVTTSTTATARMGGGGSSPRKTPKFGSGRKKLGGEFEFGGGGDNNAEELAAASKLVARTSLSPSSSASSVGTSPTAAGGKNLESPAARRRLQRAAERKNGTATVADGGGRALPPLASPSATSPIVAPKSMTSPPMPPPSTSTAQSPPVTSSIKRTKTDEESVAVSIAASSTSVAASTAGSGVSTERSTSRSTLRFGRRKSSGTSGQQSVTSMGTTQSKKKKSSIFGVAKLIRKASSKKSKSSSKKGMALVDDKNLFVEEEKITQATNLVEKKTEVVQVPPKEPEPVSESSLPMPSSPKEPEPPSSSSVMPPPLMAAPEIAAAPQAAAADPFGTPKSPGGDDNDGWANSDFFTDDPFASSSPFGAASPGSGDEDAFGFPTPKKSTTKKAKTTIKSERMDNDAFFTSGADSWGEPSAMLPVDFTPRKTNNAHYFEDHDQSDTVSYDATETSEITNPTFASASVVMNTTINSKPDPEGDKTVNKSNASDPFDDINKSAASDPVSDSEGTATTPVDGKESLARKYKQKKAASKRLPPTNTASSDKRNVTKGGSTSVDPPLALDTMESSEDERDDNDQGRTPATQPVVARSRILSKYAKGRRQANLANNTSLGTIHSLDSKEISTMSSGRSVGSTEQRSIGSRSIGSAGQRSIGNSGANTSAKKLASADSTPIRKGRETVGSRASPAGNVINPATLSLSSRRGRMSPVGLSTSGNVSPTKLSSSPTGSPTRANKYGSANRKKKFSPSVVDNPAYYSMEARLSSIKDPIQRAGVRLLWAAAIPIQTQARRFLARQAAIRRMCAVLTIQAFVRRWLAERDLEIAIWSAIQIQASFRGWFARDSLEDNHYCATQIQRVVRGYLATMHVFEDLYSITIVQSVVRMHLSINNAVDRLSSIIAIQSWWRGIKARDVIDEMDYSAVAIQSNWRRYLAQMSYQFDIIDVIIVQSVARRWQTRRDLASIRIQCLARVMLAKARFREMSSMQTLVTRHTSAAKIQSCWRSYTAQVHMLISIVNVIVIQSLWRRRVAMKLYAPHLRRIKLARDRKRANAATIIQSTWRGFVVYSEYLIKRYENNAATIIQKYWRGFWQATNYSLIYCAMVKVQALVRGHQERSWHAFQVDCATIIQASSRRFLARKERHNEFMVSILIAAAANSLRVRNASRRLQQWWMGEMWERREKRAALIIERFFIYVKKEVEKEVKALKKKKKERRRQRKYKQSEDYILERAWLGVVDDTAVPVMPAAVPQRAVASPHRKKSYNKKNDKYSAKGVIQSVDEDVQSYVSGLTDLDFGNRNNNAHKKKPIRDFGEDASLEEALRDSEAQLTNEQRQGGHRSGSKKKVSSGYPRRYDR